MSATSVLRHHPRASENDAGKQIVIPVRYFGYVQVLLAVWVAVWLLMEGALAWGFVETLRGAADQPPQSAAVLGILLAVFTAAGAFMIWRLLWVRRGREILQITPDLLTVRREPTGGQAEEYARDRIRGLHVGSYAGNLVYPSWGRRFIGKEECYISFEYDGKIREIARGMSRDDAETVVRLLRGA